MFATVNRDEDADPAPYPDPVPRPGGTGVTTDPSGADVPSRGASAAEIVTFLNSP